MIYRYIYEMIGLSVSDEKKTKDIHKMLNFFNQRGFELDKDFEKNIAKNIMRLL